MSGIQGLRERQQGLRQVNTQQSQIDQQVQELQRADQNISQALEEERRSAQRQEALRVLIQKGKGSDALYGLSPKEQSQIRDIASELKRQRENSVGRRAIYEIESQLGQSLGADVRQAIAREAVSTGKVEFNVLGTSIPQTKPLIQGPTQRFQDEQYFRETGQYKPAPLVVSAGRPSLATELKSIGSQAKQRFKAGDLPTIINTDFPRAVTTTLSRASSKTGEFLTDKGIIGRDSPVQSIFTPRNLPISSGGIALGTLFAPAFATGTSQAATESEYVFDAITGTYIKKEAASKLAQQRLAQALQDSATTKRLGVTVRGGSVPTESELREIARKLVQRNQGNPQNLAKLRQFFKENNRLDLYDDLVAQEGPIVRQGPPGFGAVDVPNSITGAGSITGAATRSESIYAGTGQYEKTNAVATRIPNIQNLALRSDSQLAFGNGQNLFLKSSLQQTPKTQTAQQTKQFSENLLGLRQDTAQQNRQRQERAQRSGLGLSTAQTTGQKLAQRALELLRSRSSQRSGQRPGRSTGLGLLPRRDVLFGNNRPIQETLNLFKAQVRRRGKFIDLPGSESTSIEETFRKAAGKVDTSLAASFRVLKNGETVRANSLPIGFTRSKRDRDVFVELPSRRLSTGSERKEIQLFKKQKGRKNIFGI